MGEKKRILPDYTDVSRKNIEEAVGMAIGAASICWDPMDCTGVFQEDDAGQIIDELMMLVEKYAHPVQKHISEPIELPSQKIAVTTSAGGVRQVIGEAEIDGDVVRAVIPLSALQLGVIRAVKHEASKGFSLRKPEIIFKPAEMVTGVLFPVELKFQITDAGQYDDT